MRLPARTRILVTIAVIAASSMMPRVGPLRAAQSGRADAGNANRDDPCDQLPDPPGKALGIDKKCPPGGSSSGVAKGDFDGDGFADLAIGEPGATVGGFAAAGDVIVIYGSANGLTATGNQFWSQDNRGIIEVAEAGDRFGRSVGSANFGNGTQADLVVGVPDENVGRIRDAGGVNVVYGSGNGLTATGNQFFTENTPGILQYSQPGDQLGYA